MNLETLTLCAFALSGCATDTENREPSYPEGATKGATAPDSRSGASPGKEATPAKRAPGASKGGPGAVADPTAGAEAWARVDENLARLRALEVFEVGALVVALPAEATNCYGPCPGFEGVIKAARESAAVRLARFADDAVAAAKAPSGYLCTAQIDQNLVLLTNLAIVEVKGIVKAQPTNNVQCYGYPCQADIAAAAAIDETRAAALDSIVRRTAKP